jgi:alanyl-tRNA synthetase
VRLEFVSGEAAVQYVQKQESDIFTIIRALGSNRDKLLKSFEHAMNDSEFAKKKLKQLIKRTSGTVAKQSIELAKDFGPVKFYSVIDEELDEEFHIAVGDEAVKQNPSMIYCALIVKGTGIKIIIFAGEQATKVFKAGDLVREVSAKLGGSGGGDARFGQGGGKDTAKLADALTHAELLIKKIVSS